MTKRDIAIAVSKNFSDFSVTQREVAVALNTVLEEIKGALSRGDRIELRDFGVFSVHDARRKKARNPRTNEVVSVPPHKRVKFTAGKDMKELAMMLTENA